MVPQELLDRPKRRTFGQAGGEGVAQVVEAHDLAPASPQVCLRLLRDLRAVERGAGLGTCSAVGHLEKFRLAAPQPAAQSRRSLRSALGRLGVELAKLLLEPPDRIGEQPDQPVTRLISCEFFGIRDFEGVVADQIAKQG